MASKLTTRTSTKAERKPGPVTVTQPTNGTEPHVCACPCGRSWSPRAAKPAHPCACDARCTATTKRTFAQGHDAKAYAFLRHLDRNGGPKSKADNARLAHLRGVGFVGAHS